MSSLFRREIPMVLLSAIIALLLFDYYIEIQFVRSIATTLSEWAIIITATIAGLGIINQIVRVHSRVVKKTPYWYLDAWMLAVMVVVIASGLYTVGMWGSSPTFSWITMNMHVPLVMAIDSLAAFEISAGLYRTFRARSIGAGILVVVAGLVILRQIPAAKVILEPILPLSEWIWKYPTNAASRGFFIISAIGTMGFAIRALFGTEKSTLGMTD
jgi:hypothetical protein